MKTRIRSVSGKTTFIVTFLYFRSTILMDLVNSRVTKRASNLPAGNRSLEPVYPSVKVGLVLGPVQDCADGRVLV